MTTIRSLVVSVLCTTLLTALVPAQEHGKPGEKPAPSAPAKPAPVFVIANMHGKHEVLTKEAFEAKNKAMAEEFKKAEQMYEKEKKAAEAAKKKFDGKEPKKMMAEMVGGEFTSKEAAEAAMKKMDEKPKEPKKDDTPKPHK